MGGPLEGHAGWVRCLAFATDPEGRLLLASGGWDKTVRLWDLATGVCAITLRRRTSVRSIAVAGRVLAIGDVEGCSVIEWDGYPGP